MRTPGDAACVVAVSWHTASCLFLIPLSQPDVSNLKEIVSPLISSQCTSLNFRSQLRSSGQRQIRDTREDRFTKITRNENGGWIVPNSSVIVCSIPQPRNRRNSGGSRDSFGASVSEHDSRVSSSFHTPTPALLLNETGWVSFCTTSY